MSVLFPLMWLAAAGIAIPLWLHMRRRDETDLVEFSAMRFLEDQPVARARPLWPRNWILMLLRMAALLLLIAAFAWPYRKGEDAVIVEESRVYILDNTLSLQRDNQFEANREQLLADLSEADLTTQIAVVELTGAAETIVPFGLQSKAAETIRSLKASDARGNYVDAFRTASDLLRTSLGDRKSIVLLGDSQTNQWTEGAGSAPFLGSVTVTLPEDVAAPVTNLSLAEPAARRIEDDGRSLVECVVRVDRLGEISNARLTFAVDGQEVAAEDIEFQSDKSDRETISVFATWESPKDEWLLGTATITADSESFEQDNTVVFSLPPSRPGRVLGVFDSRYLGFALSPDVMRGRWDTQQLNAPKQSDFSGEVPPDVVILESRKLVDESVRAGLRDTLNSGHGVVLLVDRSTPLVVGFLREMGIEMPARSERIVSDTTFRYVFAEHPIFRVFRSAEFGEISSIAIARFRKMQMPNAVPVAFATGGDPLIFDAKVGTGRLLVLAFGLDRDDTNWPLQPTFVPFVDACLTHVRALTVTGTAYEPAESVVWELPPGEEASSLRVTHRPYLPSTEDATENTTSKELTREVQVLNRKASFQLPPRIGHYELRYDASDELAAVLDVNASRLESELDFDPTPEVVNSWQVESIDPSPSDSEAPEPDDLDAVDLSKLEILQQDLWWWFLLAAILAVIAETIWVATASLRAPP